MEKYLKHDTVIKIHYAKNRKKISSLISMTKKK